VLTVEEPESHLHPTAQRAMAEEIHRLPGQVVATSHSPEFVNSAKGRLALLRAVGGKSSIQSVVSQNRLLQDHPHALFARSLMITEGREGRMLPYFAQALKVSLHGAGIEVLDARGQGNIVKLWEFFGSRGLEFPTVFLADADHQNFLKPFLKENVVDPLPTEHSKIVKKLRAQDYFICKYGECLEQELAQCAAQHIDKAFQEKGEPTFEEWRESNKNQELSSNWKKKLNAKLIGDLTDDASARALRLSRWKNWPEDVARLMTKDGTDATLIPKRFKKALRRAETLARSQPDTS